MATYQVTGQDGSTYEVSGDPAKVEATIHSILSPQQDTSFDANKAVSNIIPDIKGMLMNLGGTVKEGAFDMPGRALATGVQMAGGVPYAKTPSGQKDTEFVRNTPAMLDQMAQPITHPVNYLQEHPVQQALNVLGAGQMAAGGAGAALDSIPATENVLPSLERIANNQTLKGFGGTMGQLRQMAQGRGGMEALDEAARYARDNGLADVFTTEIGRKKTLDNLLENSGKTIGNFRKEAGPAPADLIKNLLSNPKANMDEYLGNGLASGELSKADQALEDIKRIGGENPTHASMADAATYINKQAAGGKLYQPMNAATDVANALSDENNQGIAQSLGSDKAKQYVQALEDQQKLHPLEHLQERGELRAAGGRGGIGLQMVQKLADEFGYRLSAKTAAFIHDSLVGNNQEITKAAVASKLASFNPNPSIVDLIGQLKNKYDQRRKM